MQIDLPIVKKVTLPALYKSADVKRIFSALEDDCLFVGGCVRDVLLSQENNDIDLATPLLPSEVIRKLNSAQVKVVETGLEHGTVTAVSGRHNVEITTLRKDVETDGRRAVVAFTKDWVEDAYRRDFTFNSLLMDMKGAIYDPTRTGIHDLEKRNVVFIGNASERIKEDYIRILRYFRFSARFEMDLDPDILTLFDRHSAGLDCVSKERITGELLRIIESPRPQESVVALAALDYFSWFEANCHKLNEFCAIQDQYDSFDLFGRLYLIGSTDPGGIKHNLILSKKQLGYMADIGIIISEYAHRSTNYLLYYYNHKAVAQAAFRLFVNHSITESSVEHLLSEIGHWDTPAFPLTGADLIAAGHTPNAVMGKVLRHVEAWWLKNGFKATKNDCLAHATRWYEANEL